jgi:hypothetical protein
MLKINKIILLFVLSVWILFSFWITNVNAWFIWEIGAGNSQIYLCQWDECGFEQWVVLVKDAGIDGIKTEGTATEQIQKVIIYLLWFITLIAVIYIIYAGFRILVSSGEDDTLKKSKSTIIYVIVWILVIWFAWTIANFAVTLWNWGV